MARRISAATWLWRSRGFWRSSLDIRIMLVSVASFDWGVAVTVAAPQRPREVSSPGSTEPIDRDELEALIEALIEEARQRARRRRRRYGAVALFVALVAGGCGPPVSITVAARPARSPPRRARRVAQRPGSPARSRLEAGRLRMGHTGVTFTSSPRRPTPRASSMSAPPVASLRARTAAATGTAPGWPVRAEGWNRATDSPLSCCRSACSGNGVCG